MTRGQYEWRLLLNGQVATHLWWKTPEEAIAAAEDCTQRTWNELTGDGWACVEWEAQPKQSDQAPLFVLRNEFPAYVRKRKRRKKKPKA
jgi:hypothetical protein